MSDIEAEEGGEIVAETVEDAGTESMHLTKDVLKNPILDYVQHIVLSPPGSSFTCGTSASPDGQTFTKYEDVRSSFINGDISPEQLKKGLIVSLNQLLQPVRDHFTNDENAKHLLDKVREFKRTSAPSTDDAPKVVRNDLTSNGTVPANSHFVMTSLPRSNPTLQSAADLLAKLSAAPAKETPKVLMLMDWTARVNGALDADAKLLSAYYSVMLTSLRALDVQLNGEENAVMKDVTVLLQSDAILKDPSNYWISVINAGRHFSLDTVMGSGIGLGEGMKDSENVGAVIGRLMMVADVLAVNPKSVALDITDEIGVGLAGLSLQESSNGSEAPGALSVEAYLIQDYYRAKLNHPSIASQFSVPDVVHISNGPNLQLQPPRESAALKTEFDEYFLLDDPKVNAKSKMKKSFCEPGNIDFCPPIELLAYFGGLESGKEVTIQRTDDNGGNVTYTSKADLRKDFESGSLHPGDLKALVSSTMLEILTFISDELKKDDEATKGAKALKAFEKKMKKK
jgi:hypothetical protein